MDESGRVIGVDLGLRRVGLAVSDAMGLMAHPLGVIPYRGAARLAEHLKELAESRGASSFVVGFPRNMDGSVGESGKRSQKFAETLRRISGMPVVLSDERLTTSQAEKEMIALGKSRKDRKAVIDEAAAVLILENHLKRVKAIPNAKGQ